MPPALQRVFEFPYSEGRQFALQVAARGGEAGIVNAFNNLPVSTEQIMDVDAYLNDEQPANVPTPPVPTGATIRQQGTIGAFLLSLVAERTLGQGPARELALAWDGDAYVLYDHDGKTCIAATYRLDDPTSAQKVADALTATGATATAQARTVQTTTCK